MHKHKGNPNTGRLDKNGIEDLRKKFTSKIDKRRGVAFKVNLIMDHTETNMIELANVLQVHEASVYTWSRGLTMPHHINRDKIERLYTQRVEGKVTLNADDLELIENPKPLITYNKKRKKEGEPVIKPLSELELSEL